MMTVVPADQSGSDISNQSHLLAQQSRFSMQQTDSSFSTIQIRDRTWFLYSDMGLPLQSAPVNL
jgi:hypothetical protein